MDERQINQVVEAVLRELTAAGGPGPCGGSGGIPTAGSIAGAGCTDGFAKVLIVGPMSEIPADQCVRCECFDIEDYVRCRNVDRYDRLLITGLSMAQLSDIAQGRDGSPEACAVIRALLSGIDVWMLESALPHRQYAGMSSSRLYQVIENNVRLIQTYGVRMVRKKAYTEPRPATPPRYQAPQIVVPQGHGQPNSEKLITEETAKRMTASGEKALCIAKDAIVTPSAWDYFKYHGVEVTRG